MKTLAPRLAGFVLLWAGVQLTAAAAVLLHDYQLNGNLLDALGGPALVDLGGTVGASGYSFGANEGLKLMDGLADTSDYSIEFLAQYSSLLVDDFEKMVDFQNLTDDQGLYIEDIGADNNILRFYDFATGTDAVLAGEDFHVVLTRNGATGDTMGYLDGVLQWMFTDDGTTAPLGSEMKIEAISASEVLTTVRSRSLMPFIPKARASR